MVLEPSAAFALLSCDPGRDTWNTVMGTFIDANSPPETGVYIWNYADADASSHPQKLKLLDYPASPSDFHPLGIHLHSASNTLYIVNHAASGSRVEVFRLFPAEQAATHIKTMKHELLAAPNSITALSESEILVTCDHYFLRKNQPILAQVETYTGIPGGSVVHVDLGADEAKVNLVTRVPFANGIAQLNTTTFAVASTSTNAVYLYLLSRHDGPPRLTRTATISLSFHPDNLSVDGAGNLLIAGHPHGPTFEEVMKDAAARAGDGDKTDEKSWKGSSWVAKWNPSDGLKTLYVGDEYGTSCTAVRDSGRKLGMAVGLYERGVLTWTE